VAARARLGQLSDLVNRGKSGAPLLERAVEETDQRLEDIGYLSRRMARRNEPYTPGQAAKAKTPRRTKTKAWEEEQRRQAIEEANETARGRSEVQPSDLLSSIQKSGGLPTPRSA
jgi:hypothetical protein